VEGARVEAGNSLKKDLMQENRGDVLEQRGDLLSTP
jgi:hypothetical protein